MKATTVLALLPLALAAPQAIDPSMIAPLLQSEGFNPAAASYLAGQFQNSAIVDAFDSIAQNPAAAFPTDASGAIAATGIAGAYAGLITAAPQSEQAALSSVLGQAMSLQGGAAGSVSGMASSIAASASSVAKSAGSSASAAMSSATGSAASAATSASGAATSATKSAAANGQVQVGVMAGMLAGIAGLAAAL